MMRGAWVVDRGMDGQEVEVLLCCYSQNIDPQHIIIGSVPVA